MENEDRIVELLAESLKKFDRLSDQMETLTSRVDNLTNHVDTRLNKVEQEIIKLNLISAENSRALIKLADTYDRIARLEKAVFK